MSSRGNKGRNLGGRSASVGLLSECCHRLLRKIPGRRGPSMTSRKLVYALEFSYEKAAHRVKCAREDSICAVRAVWDRRGTGTVGPGFGLEEV